jgi:O-antigen chain-terminating methyltransferase
MIKTNNSEIKLDGFMTQVRDLEEKSVYTHWQRLVNCFPLKCSKWAQRFVLKVLGLIFLGQREINTSLIATLKESLKIHQMLKEQETTLQIQITELQNSIQLFQKKISTLPERIKIEKCSLDAFYVKLEDKFRGTREDIKQRLRIYLPIITQTNIGKQDSAILDVGCGRGEWLELLRESDYIARGLDMNRIMIEQCLGYGMDVVEGDVITYLRSLPDSSLGAVTGFHIIEHLPFEVLTKLLDETVRVLKPGGLAIFETPNPQNVLVASNTFYLDPTHRNPLPSPLIKFLVEARGLCQVTVMNLHPCTDTLLVPGASDLTQRFNEYFYGPRDYAVIGYKN